MHIRYEVEHFSNAEFSPQGLDPHHLQEDYVGMYLDDMDRAPAFRHSNGPSTLLRTAALVAIPGLGAPREARTMVGEALGSSFRERHSQEDGLSDDEEGFSRGEYAPLHNAATA